MSRKKAVKVAKEIIRAWPEVAKAVRDVLNGMKK
jgi:hypothetical protein